MTRGTEHQDGFDTGRRPTVLFSIIGGVTVAWDVCAGCRQQVSRCACETGPVEPAYLVAERTPIDPPVLTAPPTITSAA